MVRAGALADVRFAWRADATDEEFFTLTQSYGGRAEARDRNRARPHRCAASRCEWMEVDFDEHLAPFSYEACGFSPTPAGLLHLPGLPFAHPA